MSKKDLLFQVQQIESLIHFVRGRRIILGSDLAKLYGVVSWRLNEQVKRNKNRFPEDFVFKLTYEEEKALTSQIARSNKQRGGRRTLPYAFTEHGVVMAANVLNTPRAAEVSVFVVRVFIKIREAFMVNNTLQEKLSELENKLTGRLNVHEKAIVHLLDELKRLMSPPILPIPKKRPIGFGREE